MPSRPDKALEWHPQRLQLAVQMIAFVGFAVQALVTREGPIEGLFAHISDPLGHNILSNLLKLPNVLGGQSIAEAISP